MTPKSIIESFRKLLGISPDATDEEVEEQANAAIEAWAFELGKQELEGDPKVNQVLQEAHEANLKANNLVERRDDSGAIRTIHKDSPEAKKLHALSADLVPKLRAFSAAASRITPLDREVMKRLCISPAQWLLANA